MPATLKRALADSFALDHPDVPWSPPAVLPSVRDLREGIEILTAERCSRKHAAFCLAKLSVAFEAGTKLGADDARMRVEIWIEACGDLPEDLWSKATIAALQASKWMPKPAEFRAFVDNEMAERTKQLRRCQDMLARHGDAPKTEDFQREPEEQRLRATIWRGWEFRVGIRTGFMAEKAWAWALRDERRLAEIEGRQPAAWARPTDAPGRTEPSPPGIVPETTAARRNREYLAEKARRHRSVSSFAPIKVTPEMGVIETADAPATADDYGHLASG